MTSLVRLGCGFARRGAIANSDLAAHRFGERPPRPRPACRAAAARAASCIRALGRRARPVRRLRDRRALRGCACGDSYQIVVDAGRQCTREALAPRRARALGGNPSKTKRRSGNPERTATPIAALGPGSTSIGNARRARGGDELAPGSEMPGIPASVVTATACVRARSRIPGVARGRVLLVIAPDLACSAVPRR